MRLLFILLSFVLISCEKSIEIEEAILENKSLVDSVALNAIQGSYEACRPNLVYSGYYAKAEITINGNEVEITDSIHANSACNSNWGAQKNKYIIKKLEVSTDDPTDLNIEYEVVSAEYRPLDPWYLTQNYCGITDMSLGQWHDITGLSCPTYLAADTHHSSIKSLGDEHHTIIKIIDNDNIQINQGFTESGDSVNESQVSDMFEVSRL